MPTFTIEYTKTVRALERVEIEADTPEAALALVEEYDFDNSEAWETDSLEWSLDSAAVVE